MSNQAYIFLCSIVSGMFIAFIYDLFRIKRKAVKTADILIHIEDFIYWIIVAVVMFTVVYYSNEGEIRAYIFIGTAIGAILYALLLSMLVVASFMTVIRIVSIILKAIWTVVTFPIRLLLKLLYYPGRFLGRLGKKTYSKTKRIGKRGMVRIRLYGRAVKNIIKKI